MKPPLAQVTGNFLPCPRWVSNPDRGKEQLAVSGNALDHTAIRTGPRFFGVHNSLNELPCVCHIIQSMFNDHFLLRMANTVHFGLLAFLVYFWKASLLLSAAFMISLASFFSNSTCTRLSYSKELFRANLR